MSNFKLLKSAVATQFAKMQQYQLFRTGVSKDALWDTYLGSFPAGSNPIYKERTSHDCNCCKQFIRAVGDTVAVIDGELVSIWDVVVADEAYQAVVDALSQLVKSYSIENAFLHYEKTAGVDHNHQLVDLAEGQQSIRWEHFFVNINKEFVKEEVYIASTLGKFRSSRDVFGRALKEIDLGTIETVLELIDQNSLYRGEEHKFVVTEFRQFKRKYEALDTDLAKDLFVWNTVVNDAHAGSIINIRNSVIGSLLLHIAEGYELEHAVKAFEAKVAPTNYKRPTALISKSMIESAQKKINELGLTSALQRRYATLTDITINNILFANRESKKVLTGNIFDELASKTSDNIKNLDKVEEVSIDKFINDILPKADSIEVLFENRHVPNLVSLVAPVDPTAGNLFKWDNNFSWSYNGEVTDSIKEKVKAAGGNVTGDLCCRLAWYNHDDLDFHMTEPNGNKIYFAQKVSPNTKGKLDVDMNAGGGQTRTPVENIFYNSRSHMTEGIYTLQVKNFSKRETKDVGFEVELDYLGSVTKFAYVNAVKDGEIITVAKFKYTHANGIEFIESLPSSQSVTTVCNIPTQSFHNVDVMMLSPNHWDDKAVGNKHYFFMLRGCVNDEPTRGFYNEFLKSELDGHRKVFEIVGSKMKTEKSNDQLSGLGFSSTQRNSVTVRVKGSFSRLVKINF